MAMWGMKCRKDSMMRQINNSGALTTVQMRHEVQPERTEGKCIGKKYKMKSTRMEKRGVSTMVVSSLKD